MYTSHTKGWPGDLSLVDRPCLKNLRSASESISIPRKRSGPGQERCPTHGGRSGSPSCEMSRGRAHPRDQTCPAGSTVAGLFNRGPEASGRSEGHWQRSRAMVSLTPATASSDTRSGRRCPRRGPFLWSWFYRGNVKRERLDSYTEGGIRKIGQRLLLLPISKDHTRRQPVRSTQLRRRIVEEEPLAFIGRPLTDCRCPSFQAR